MALARKKPRDKQELSQIHGMSRGQIRRYGGDLLQIIAENRGAAAPQRPRHPPRPPEEVLDRYERLRTWRKKRGQARGVESDVIVSREALWEIAWANPQTGSELQEVENLGPWRRKTYGEEILRLLNNGTGG
jgi:ribonuclease D